MKTYFVDSFTREAYKGNPAAVCFPETQQDEKIMLKVAAEIGFSETVFLFKTDSADQFRIRYFSPKMEIPLCGHATLASAKILFSITSLDSVQFTTFNKTILTVSRSGERIRMDFPVYSTVAASVKPETLAALGVPASLHTVYSPNNKIIMIEIESADTLKRLDPDFNALIQSQDGINGILVTAQAGDGIYDYHYRYFWPWAGTNEDPVTGGVQTFLAKYWADKLKKNKLKAFQSSRRTGSMDLELHDDKVSIIGEAVIVLEGNWVAVG